MEVGFARRNNLLALFILLCFSLNALYAAGTTGLSLLRIGMGSRAQGMGGAYTAVSSDINGIYYNPAGLMAVTIPKLMFHHSRWIEDISIENISGVARVSHSLRLAGGISFLHLPQLDRYDIDPSSGEAIQMGRFGIHDLVAQAGITYGVFNRLSVGFQAKYIQEKIDNVLAQGVAWDLGVLYHLPVDYLSLGAAVQNLGPGIKYVRMREKLPTTYRFGIAYQLPYNNLIFSVDALKPVEEKWQFLAGLEVGLGNILMLRNGYRIESDNTVRYDFGVGLRVMDRYEINYSYFPFGELGAVHKAEFVISFGRRGERAFEKRAEETIPSVYVSNRETAPGFSHVNPKAGELVPAGLTALQIGDKLLLRWDAINIPGAQYHVYIRMTGKHKLIRVTRQPVTRTDFVFTPQAEKLSGEFFISTVINGRESGVSDPVQFHFTR